MHPPEQAYARTKTASGETGRSIRRRQAEEVAGPARPRARRSRMPPDRKTRARRRRHGARHFRQRIRRQAAHDRERAAESEKLVRERPAEALRLRVVLRRPTRVPALGRAIGLETAAKVFRQRALQEQTERKGQDERRRQRQAGQRGRAAAPAASLRGRIPGPAPGVVRSPAYQEKTAYVSSNSCTQVSQRHAHFRDASAARGVAVHELFV